MATEVLRPQDLLAERFHDHPASFHRHTVFPATTEKLKLSILTLNRKQCRKAPSPPPPKPDRKRSAAKPNRSNHQHGSGAPAPRTAQVTHLRRGESLSSIADGNQIRNPATDLSVPKQIRLAPGDIYAGSAFSMSPSPRSVPLPSFFGKKDSNDGATRDLRRLLRLE